MRIPLDYYRILGLPIQATAEQLQQAHRDRALQLPRREYSEAAIAARKQLIDEAYAVLSDADQRKAYDASFLAKSYELEPDTPPEKGTNDSANEGSVATADPTSDPYTPSIEIQDQQLVGALLILLELGEYELVLKLGRPYLSSGSISLENGRYGEPEIVRADIVLTIAFACLELGREQWHQGQYENAAESLETGQELLLREGLFPSVRGEMQSDLFKLRPYRILELLALPENHEAERVQGLTLLRAMLQDRSGIDGTGDDQSGLTIDDFLRFIQQLRGYLTVSEQQTLFEAEARRPSAVATYLAVYALLARGFAQRQPALIRRAKLMLIRLGTRQDVHLEQAVCALLLGQTEEASRALELSQEYESLAFIREHSQGSPDLLPGLCLYGERWLQNEVFPHFRDLANQRTSLKEYFADEHVQGYLEELPNEPGSTNQWAEVRSSVAPQRPTSIHRASSNGVHTQSVHTQPNVIGQAHHPRRPTPDAPSSTATIDTEYGRPSSASNGTAAMPMAERISHLSPEGKLDKDNVLTATATSNGPAARSPQSPPERHRGPTGRVPASDSPPLRRSGSRGPKLDRLLFVIAAGLLGISVLGFAMSRVFSQVFASGPTLDGDQLQIRLDQPPVAIPDPDTEITGTSDPNGPLTDATAQQIVEAWLTAKSKARGANHDIDALDTILTGQALTDQRYLAEDLARNNSYWEYEHQVISAAPSGDSASPTAEASPDSSSLDGSFPDRSSWDSSSPDQPETGAIASDQGEIEAEVTETAEFYQNGQLDLGVSYDSTVRVRYDLVRQDGEWRIRNIQEIQ